MEQYPQHNQAFFDLLNHLNDCISNKTPLPHSFKVCGYEWTCLHHGPTSKQISISSIDTGCQLFWLDVFEPTRSITVHANETYSTVCQWGFGGNSISNLVDILKALKIHELFILYPSQKRVSLDSVETMVETTQRKLESLESKLNVPSIEMSIGFLSGMSKLDVCSGLSEDPASVISDIDVVTNLDSQLTLGDKTILREGIANLLLEIFSTKEINREETPAQQDVPLPEAKEPRPHKSIDLKFWETIDAVRIQCAISEDSFRESVGISFDTYNKLGTGELPILGYITHSQLSIVLGSSEEYWIEVYRNCINSKE